MARKESPTKRCLVIQVIPAAKIGSPLSLCYLRHPDYFGFRRGVKFHQKGTLRYWVKWYLRQRRKLPK